MIKPPQTNDALGAYLGFQDVVVISFNIDYISQATDLSLIVTLYHEMLHAYIIDLYHDGELLNIYPNYTSLKGAIDNNLLLNTIETNQILDDESHNIYIVLLI